MFIKGQSTLEEILPYLQDGDNDEYNGVEKICIKEYLINNEPLYVGPAYKDRLKPWLNRIVDGLHIYPYYVEIQLSNKMVISEKNYNEKEVKTL